MSKSLFTLALFLSASIFPLAAHADAVDDFLITGQGNAFTFSLPASPIDVFVSTGAGGSPTNIQFFSGQLFYVGAGLSFFADSTAFTLVGPTGLYPGSAYEPIFKTGTLDLPQFQAFPTQDNTLTITPKSTPPEVPEPSSLLLFFSGAAGLLYRVMKPRPPQTFF
jgi:hypothetical protein